MLEGSRGLGFRHGLASSRSGSLPVDRVFMFRARKAAESVVFSWEMRCSRAWRV